MIAQDVSVRMRVQGGDEVATASSRMAQEVSRSGERVRSASRNFRAAAEEQRYLREQARRVAQVFDSQRQMMPNLTSLLRQTTQEYEALGYSTEEQAQHLAVLNQRLLDIGVTQEQFDAALQKTGSRMRMHIPLMERMGLTQKTITRAMTAGMQGFSLGMQAAEGTALSLSSAVSTLSSVMMLQMLGALNPATLALMGLTFGLGLVINRVNEAKQRMQDVSWLTNLESAARALDLYERATSARARPDGNLPIGGALLGSSASAEEARAAETAFERLTGISVKAFEAIAGGSAAARERLELQAETQKALNEEAARAFRGSITRMEIEAAALTALTAAGENRLAQRLVQVRKESQTIDAELAERQEAIRAHGVKVQEIEARLDAERMAQALKKKKERDSTRTQELERDLSTARAQGALLADEEKAARDLADARRRASAAEMFAQVNQESRALRAQIETGQAELAALLLDERNDPFALQRHREAEQHRLRVKEIRQRQEEIRALLAQRGLSPQLRASLSEQLQLRETQLEQEERRNAAAVGDIDRRGREEFDRRLNAATMSSHELEREELDRHYKQLREMARQNVKDQAEQQRILTAIDAAEARKRQEIALAEAAQRSQLATQAASHILQAFGVLYSGARKNAGIHKGLAVTQALIDTYSAYTGALAMRPWSPLNFALATTTLGLGLAKVAAISKQKFNAGGFVRDDGAYVVQGIWQGGDKVPAMLNPRELVMTEGMQAKLLSMLTSPGRATAAAAPARPSVSFSYAPVVTVAPGADPLTIHALKTVLRAHKEEIAEIWNRDYVRKGLVKA